MYIYIFIFIFIYLYLFIYIYLCIFIYLYLFILFIFLCIAYISSHSKGPEQDQLRSPFVPYVRNTAERSIHNFDSGPYIYIYICNLSHSDESLLGVPPRKKERKPPETTAFYHGLIWYIFVKV